MISSHCTYVLWVAWNFLSGQVTCVSTVMPKAQRNFFRFQAEHSKRQSFHRLWCFALLLQGGKLPKTSEKIQRFLTCVESFQGSDMMKWHDASRCVNQILLWKLSELQSRLTGSELFLWGRKGVLRRQKNTRYKVNAPEVFERTQCKSAAKLRESFLPVIQSSCTSDTCDTWRRTPRAQRRSSSSCHLVLILSRRPKQHADDADYGIQRDIKGFKHF